MDDRSAARLQAAYFVSTGVFPFISRRGFEAITGPKREWWLVQTVGLLVTAIGAGLWRAAERDEVPDDVALIAAGAAASLAAVDVVYVARRRIRATYLLDAAVELAILEGWRRARWPRS
jgi:hypothetical protein